MTVFSCFLPKSQKDVFFIEMHLKMCSNGFLVVQALHIETLEVLSYFLLVFASGMADTQSACTFIKQSVKKDKQNGVFATFVLKITISPLKTGAKEHKVSCNREKLA